MAEIMSSTIVWNGWHEISVSPGDVLVWNEGTSWSMKPSMQRMCAVHHVGMRAFLHGLHEMQARLLDVMPAGGRFDEMDYRAAAVIAGRFAAWAEEHVPKKCGVCEVCLSEAGKCPHGWSEKRICPDCRGDG